MTRVSVMHRSTPSHEGKLTGIPFCRLGGIKTSDTVRQLRLPSRKRCVYGGVHPQDIAIDCRGMKRASRCPASLVWKLETA